MIARATNKEGLWFILETIVNKGKGATPSNLDEKKESLLYIMTWSTKSGLLEELIDFDDPKELWNFLKINFEIFDDSCKFHLRNKFSLITMTEESTFEQYFSKFKSVLAQLLALGVKVLNANLVQIMMKVVPNNYDFSMQQYTNQAKFPSFQHLQTILLLEESRQQIRKGVRESLEALYFHYNTPLNERSTLKPFLGINTMSPKLLLSVNIVRPTFNGGNNNDQQIMGLCNYCGHQGR
jgi:hypothetical protein